MRRQFLSAGVPIGQVTRWQAFSGAGLGLRLELPAIDKSAQVPPAVRGIRQRLVSFIAGGDPPHSLCSGNGVLAELWARWPVVRRPSPAPPMHAGCRAQRGEDGRGPRHCIAVGIAYHPRRQVQAGGGPYHFQAEGQVRSSGAAEVAARRIDQHQAQHPGGRGCRSGNSPNRQVSQTACSCQRRVPAGAIGLAPAGQRQIDPFLRPLA